MIDNNKIWGYASKNLQWSIVTKFNSVKKKNGTEINSLFCNATMKWYANRDIPVDSSILRKSINKIMGNHNYITWFVNPNSKYAYETFQIKMLISDKPVTEKKATNDVIKVVPYYIVDAHKETEKTDSDYDKAINATTLKADFIEDARVRTQRIFGNAMYRVLQDVQAQLISNYTKFYENTAVTFSTLV